MLVTVIKALPSFNDYSEAGASGTLLARPVHHEGEMANDDVVKCPLCGGFAHIENPELLKALTDPRIREQVENYIASLLRSPLEELTGVSAGKPAVHDFQKEVHSWNPCVPMWRRSPKE